MSNADLHELEEDDEPITFPPRAADGNGYVYVLEFSNGTIKVGKAVDVAKRLRDHVSDAEAFNIGAERLWCSDERRFYEMSERLLIAATAEIATGRHRKEYFTGVTFEQVRDLARAIVNDETNRRMDAAFRLTDNGGLAEAMDALCGIGLDLSTAMAVIDCYRGRDHSSGGVAA